MTEIQRWNKKMATRRAQRVMGGLFFVPPAKKMAAHREVARAFFTTNTRSPFGVVLRYRTSSSPSSSDNSCSVKG